MLSGNHYHSKSMLRTVNYMLARTLCKMIDFMKNMGQNVSVLIHWWLGKTMRGNVPAKRTGHLE